MDSASAFGAEGCEFESRRDRFLFFWTFFFLFYFLWFCWNKIPDSSSILFTCKDIEYSFSFLSFLLTQIKQTKYVSLFTVSKFLLLIGSVERRNFHLFLMIHIIFCHFYCVHECQQLHVFILSGSTIILFNLRWDPWPNLVSILQYFCTIVRSPF